MHETSVTTSIMSLQSSYVCISTGLESVATYILLTTSKRNAFSMLQLYAGGSGEDQGEESAIPEKSGEGRREKGGRTANKMSSRFSRNANCGISFWTVLLNASNIEWS